MTQMYIRKLPWIKGLIFSELQEQVEIFKYIADDIEFNLDDEKRKDY